MEKDEILEKIQYISEELGFDLVGLAQIANSEEQVSKNGERLDEWVENGYHGDMKWFTDSMEKRKDILKVMPDAKSVICVAMNYFSDTNIRMYANATNNTNGKIARYAQGRDYHKIFDKKLKLFSQKLKEIFSDGDFTPPLEANKYATKNNKFYSNIREPRAGFKYYSDTGPVLERAWAVRAGLGFIGKNTNLITKYGSWVLLGEIISSAELGLSHEKTLDFPSEKICAQSRPRSSAAADTLPARPQMFFLETSQAPRNFHGGCGSCRRCLDACPTGALATPYTVDARKCISYLTIEYKGEIPLELREKMGNRIFGCDACQEICPFNIGRSAAASASVKTMADKKALADKTSSFAKATADRKSELTEKAIAGNTQDLKEILSIKTDEEFLGKFAGSPLMRAKRRGLVRNACVAAGNSKDKSLLPYLKALLDSEPLIAEHAKWAIDKIEYRS